MIKARKFRCRLDLFFYTKLLIDYELKQYETYNDEKKEFFLIWKGKKRNRVPVDRLRIIRNMTKINMNMYCV